MNCLRCSTPNEVGAKFCKNCGMDLNLSPSTEIENSNQTVNQLLILMGIDYAIYLGWFILQKVIYPIFLKNDNTLISPVYKYFGWFTDVITILAFVAFANIVKNERARLVIIIFLILKIIFIIGYKVFKYD